MHTELIFRFLVLFLVLIVTDLFLYLSLKKIFFTKEDRQKVFRNSFWGLTILYCLYFFLSLFLIGSPLDDFVKYRSFFWVFGVYLIIYIPKLIISIVLLLNFVIRVFYDLFAKVFKLKKQFNFKIFAYFGLAAGIITFIIIIRGFVFTKTDFVVKEYSVYLKNLPSDFDNFRIVQISDFHLGSFSDSSVVKRALGIVKLQKSDMVVFTGDMVNVTFKETLPYIFLFREIEPKYGKFSVLGNHDMGDYAKWDSIPEQKYLNCQLILCEKQMGFKILNDTNYKIFKGKDSIYIAGVNNCGSYPFKKTGNFDKSLQNISKDAFTIFLTHDPALWSSQIVGKANIALTLSGHTHGMQLGINTGNVKWSPISFKYRYWLGWFNFSGQYLYVNPGVGFLGFPGRIGILPEITVFTLKKKI